MRDEALETKLPSDASSIPDVSVPGGTRSPRAQLLSLEQQAGWGPEWTEDTPSTGGSLPRSRGASPAHSAVSMATSAPPPAEDIVEVSSPSDNETTLLPPSKGRGTKRSKRALATTAAHKPIKRGRPRTPATSSEDGTMPLPVPLDAEYTQPAKPSRLHARKARAVANELADFADRTLQEAGAHVGGGM